MTTKEAAKSDFNEEAKTVLFHLTVGFICLCLISQTSLPDLLVLYVAIMGHVTYMATTLTDTSSSAQKIVALIVVTINLTVGINDIIETSISTLMLQAIFIGIAQLVLHFVYLSMSADAPRNISIGEGKGREKLTGNGASQVDGH